MDQTRQYIGRLLGQCGLDPHEAAYHVIADLPGARVRKYLNKNEKSELNLLIIPAPFKQVYIWDLMPNISVVRQFLSRGINVYALEWTLPTQREDDFGLLEYAHHLPMAAIEVIEAESGGRVQIIAGHSLGGTFAAIFATLFPERLQKLVLIDSPLAFGEHGGPIANAAAAIPSLETLHLLVGSPVPGSFINILSVSASPEVFQFQRFTDLTASWFDPQALEIHTRVGRWTYDELPLPWHLFEETIEQLFRKDRFLKGTLQIGNRRTGITKLKTPTLAIINPPGKVVPPNSLLKALAIVPNLPVAVLTYQADYGPMFQHLGPLVSPLAHKELWPQVLDWVMEYS
ncbi:alpha/beta fold hydrolase [Legionella lansingensis]|nr:alpha/beta fold hydrolase [Legionella lansingensis]